MSDRGERELGTLAAGEDEVAALLRLAGAPPALREDELRPARAAAREVWRGVVQRRAARQRQAWMAGALAASLVVAAGVIWWLRAPGAPPPLGAPVAALELRTGGVTIVPAPSAAAAGGGAALAPGAVLTSAPDGRVALRLASGASVRLDGGSRVRLTSPRALALELGALYVDSGALPGKAGEPLEIATPLGRITDLGTQFEVRLAGDGKQSLRLRVREGEVRVERGGATHHATAGSELLLDAGGGARRAAVAADDPAWQWAARAAPAIEIEGRTLAAFLDREARELGLRWTVVEPRPAQAPADIVLHGSVAGLTPEEAIEVVLAGSGLRGERAAGELRISALARGQ